MVVGRSVVGAAVGAASFVTPLYIAELAPAAFRGRLITMNIVFVTLGQVVAYIVGWAFTEYGSKETGWRWVVGLGAAPAGLQGVLVLLMPETPRWLVKAGRNDEARTVVRRVAGVGVRASAAADLVLKDIEAEVREEDEAQKARRRGSKGENALLDGWKELLSIRRNRRALIIACMLQGLQQLCGFVSEQQLESQFHGLRLDVLRFVSMTRLFRSTKRPLRVADRVFSPQNSLMYFSATIFKLLGFTSPTLTSMTVALTNFMFTVVALLIIDKVGRRRVLLYSIPFMTIGLLTCTYGFSLIKLSTAGLDETDEKPPSPPPPTANTGGAVVVLVSIMGYVAAYAIGLGNVPWMQSELFSLSVRSLGSGTATATNWGANFIVGLTFLPLMDALSPAWTFMLYAAVCVVGWWLVHRIYPETSGLSLEEAAARLERDDWGVTSRW